MCQKGDEMEKTINFRISKKEMKILKIITKKNRITISELMRKLIQKLILQGDEK